MRTSRAAIVVLALPSFVMLGLFYSLALHMRYSLGAWPTSIGDRGFPPGLITHGHITWNFCSALLLASFIVVPAGILACLLVPRWRPFTRYFATYALFYVSCWGLMLLAPSPFLNWWWD